MILEQMLETVVKSEASDLYLKSDSPPCVRLHGIVGPLGDQKITAAEVENIARTLIGPERWTHYENQREYNMAYMAASGGRFRVNIYMQRGAHAIVLRRVKLEIPSLEELRLPDQLKELALLPRGLIIITGPTGSGKSTTMAAMLDYRNQTLPGHIITIEDPIEYLYEDKKSIFSQREVGIDTLSFDNALKNTLREAPDVISIGEIRDLETAITALTMAETGHLVLATLHSSNSYQSLERLISLFTADREKQLLFVLSLNLRAIVCQRLIPMKGEKGRVVATECLLNTPHVRDIIRENQISDIKEVLKRGEEEGVHSFDQQISALYEQGLISEENALLFADSQSEIRMKMKGFQGVLRQV